MSHSKLFLRFLLLVLLVADALTVSAQGLSVASFRRLDNDLTANPMVGSSSVAYALTLSK